MLNLRPSASFWVNPKFFLIAYIRERATRMRFFFSESCLVRARTTSVLPDQLTCPGSNFHPITLCWWGRRAHSEICCRACLRNWNWSSIRAEYASSTPLKTNQQCSTIKLVAVTFRRQRPTTGKSTLSSRGCLDQMEKERWQAFQAI